VVAIASQVGALPPVCPVYAVNDNYSRLRKVGLEGENSLILLVILKQRPIPHVKFGKVVRFRWSEVERCLEMSERQRGW
jgi:hypothetical protein